MSSGWAESAGRLSKSLCGCLVALACASMSCKPEALTFLCMTGTLGLSCCMLSIKNPLRYVQRLSSLEEDDGRSDGMLCRAACGKLQPTA